MIYTVAERAGKLPSEVEAGTTWREIWEWNTYFKMEGEAVDRARREAKNGGHR